MHALRAFGTVILELFGLLALPLSDLQSKLQPCHTDC
jgi:hypothetical protein